MRSVLASLLLLISAFYPAGTHSLKQFRREFQRRTMRPFAAWLSEMERAWNAHDADAYAAQFTPDAEHVNAYGMWWRGRREIADAMRFVLSRIYPTNP